MVGRLGNQVAGTAGAGAAGADGGTPTAPVAFAWAAVPGAASYRLQVAPSPTFAGGVYAVVTTATSANLPTWQKLQPGATYHWRVQARTSGGDGLWSDPITFTAP